ncbi:hypothetical protein ACWD33_22580 [Streptomyces xiamenensis]|uniref:Uncharacterized protein n=1 Tax=Streptomyces xiamenensis TaxID=408015 RepID=A0A0F7FPV8_9ACTN|nr:hypothetical protein SXIM_00440 [Streptomyces xiamenensis]
MKGEYGGGEGEPGDLLTEFKDLSVLVGDGLLELDDGLAKLLLALRQLLGLGADALAEGVLQVRVAFHQGHAVDSGFGREGGGSL